MTKNKEIDMPDKPKWKCTRCKKPKERGEYPRGLIIERRGRICLVCGAKSGRNTKVQTERRDNLEERNKEFDKRVGFFLRRGIDQWRGDATEAD